MVNYEIESLLENNFNLEEILSHLKYIQDETQRTTYKNMIMNKMNMTNEEVTFYTFYFLEIKYMKNYELDFIINNIVEDENMLCELIDSESSVKLKYFLLEQQLPCDNVKINYIINRIEKENIFKLYFKINKNGKIFIKLFFNNFNDRLFKDILKIVPLNNFINTFLNYVVYFNFDSYECINSLYNLISIVSKGDFNVIIDLMLNKYIEMINSINIDKNIFNYIFNECVVNEKKEKIIKYMNEENIIKIQQLNVLNSLIK